MLLSFSPPTHEFLSTVGTADGVKVDQVFKFVPDTTSQVTTVTADALTTVDSSSLPRSACPPLQPKQA